MRDLVVWLGWSLGALSLGLSATVAVAYMRHWQQRTSRTIVLPVHVCGNALAYALLSAFVVLSRQWMVAVPDWIVYIGFAGVVTGTVALAAICVYVFAAGPMYR